MEFFLKNFISHPEHIYCIVFSISNENRTYQENAKSLHNEKFNFLLNGLNFIIFTKIINNIKLFRILKKYYKKRSFFFRKTTSVHFGSPARTRTADSVVNSHLLCQLSYWGSDLIQYIVRTTDYLISD